MSLPPHQGQMQGRAPPRLLPAKDENPVDPRDAPVASSFWCLRALAEPESDRSIIHLHLFIRRNHVCFHQSIPGFAPRVRHDGVRLKRPKIESYHRALEKYSPMATSQRWRAWQEMVATGRGLGYDGRTSPPSPLQIWRGEQGIWMESRVVLAVKWDAFQQVR